MKAQAIYVLSLATFYFYGAQSATFTFKNYCPFTVWPGILTGSGPELSSTGFELPSLTSSTLNIPAPWSGRFWGRTECTNENGNFHCATGDCPSGQVSCNGVGGIPPVSLAEFTLAAHNRQDFFDISLVDGFNLPLSIAPQLGGSGGCTTVSCTANMNAVCPQELQVVGSSGSVIACNSACLAFNLPQFCCTGAFSTPQTCPPTNYSNIFKSQCPQAYSYAYDKSALASCTGGTNYVITFSP